MTNANTIQASRKFRNRWPCQNLLVSDEGAGAEIVDAAAVTLLVSLKVSVVSSFAEYTFRAIE